MDHIHRIRVRSREKLERLLIVFEDVSIFQIFSLEFRDAVHNLNPGDLIAPFVQGQKQSFGNIAACSKKLHLFADS